MRAVELFSGIGGFAAAARGLGIEVAAAFDQSGEANLTYRANHPGTPVVSRNLDSIPADAIPEADMWWLSPPCTPYSRRGRRRDAADPRAASLLHLIDLLPQRRPRFLALENVTGFGDSEAYSRLRKTLEDSGYAVAAIELCASQFGTPMNRPRLFVVARRDSGPLRLHPPDEPPAGPLRAFLDPEAAKDDALMVDDALVARHARGLNIVDPHAADARAICFTSNYWKCLKAAGSLLRRPDGRVRMFAPEEILRLLGFDDTFQFPPELNRRARWRLAGNSVDVRCVRHVLESLFQPEVGS